MLLATQTLRRVVLGALVASTLVAGSAKAVTFNVDNTNLVNGFMNVFDLSNNFIFASGWGVGDLNASFSGGNWTLSPNTIGDPNPFWYSPSGGPGAAGQKLMEANLYAQFDGSLAGQTVTFIGNVVSNTLTSAHVGKIFIRDFAPDYSSVVETMIPMPASGNFSISQVAINDPARHVQYGFQLKGVNVWVTDTAPFGNVVIGPQTVTPAQKSSWSRVKSLYR
jgi:hypothetical protein